MAFDPLEWIDFAERLDLNSEAARRTAVGRFYYAVFLKALLSLSHDRRIEPRGDRTDHSAVLRELKKTRWRAGVALGKLSRLRGVADYEASVEISTEDVASARLAAAEVVQMCEGDWARLP